MPRRLPRRSQLMNRLFSLRKKLVFHPFLLPLFPILSFFDHNFRELFLDNLTLPVILTISAALVGWLSLYLYMKDIQKPAIIISITLFLLLFTERFFNHTQVSGFFDSLFPRSFFIDPLLGILAILIFMLFTHLVKSAKKSFHHLTVILNILSVSLLIYPTISITYKQVMRTTHNINIAKVIKFTSVNRNPADLPDIYYLVVDRYASNRTLMDYYGFDNSEFLDYLKDKGFYIASQSAANYPMTSSSLSSSLNLRYHDDLIRQVDKNSPDETPLFHQMEDNEVVTLLKLIGYKYFHFGSMWNPTRKNSFADYNYKYQSKQPDIVKSRLNYLEQEEQNPLAIFLNSTLGEVVADELSKGENYWGISIDQMLEVSKTAKMKGPKFIFMHSMITHNPYVYYQNGYPLPKLLESEGLQKEYIDQMIFANKMLENLIDAILQGSTAPPVIILQADEGPYPDRLWRYGAQFYWRNSTIDELKEKMGILNAYYLPDAKKDLLYPSISPVNSFRVVFNLYFGQALPLLPDKSYIHASRNRPYDVYEVTDFIR